MIEHYTARDGVGGVRIVLRPNRSLTQGGLIGVVTGTAVVALAVGALSWWQGNAFAFWFAVLESLALAACLFWVWRRAGRAELIVLDRDRLYVRGLPELDDLFEAHPAWVRVETDRGRVLVSASGRRIELGGALGESERRRLAAELAALLARFREGGAPGRTF
ncbi:MAG: hypothetical protein KatS3mg126_1780 [Lysobacteraceae bacterium]|nr:MAG: hypothetical protein KatS3mg126_1780 [Xanthomonadaceae bacterium]